MRICVLLLCAALWTPHETLAAAMASADQVGGYAGHVLDKVTRRWSPPSDPVERKTRVRLRIDGSGKVIDCTPLESSGLLSMDKSVCAAAGEASGFGTPPYGLDIDVYMTFWSGKPGPRPTAPEVRSEPPASHTQPVRPAAAAPSAAPPAPRTSAAPQPAPGKAAPQPAVTEKRQQPVRPAAAAPPAAPSAPQTSAASQPAPGKVFPQFRPEEKKTKPEEKKAKKGKGNPADVEARYANTVMTEISPNVAIPSTLPNGKYSVGVMVHVDGRGKITQARTARSSGYSVLDGAVTRGVLRTGKVGTPPGNAEQNLDLTFIIQKP